MRRLGIVALGLAHPRRTCPASHQSNRRNAMRGLSVVILLATAVVLVTGVRPPETGATATGKMYWVQYSAGGAPGVIRRANLDGSGAEDLVTGVCPGGGIALDIGAGKMYWTQEACQGPPAKIRRANLDGTAVEDVLTTGLTSPSEIALDVAGGKMYWSDPFSFRKIHRASLHGSGAEDLVIVYPNHPFGIALNIPTAVGGIAELPDVTGGRLDSDGTSSGGMGSATYAVLAGAAAGVLAFAVLATLSVKRRRVR